MLILPIKKKWLDMILTGEKKEEYRQIKSYCTVRIVHWLGFPDSETDVVMELLREKRTEKELPVILQNGYGADAPEVEVMCTLSIGTGKEEWGAAPGKEYFRFHIEKVSKFMGADVV
ncbi:protein-tyrosine phosphatase family protein [Acetatifactor aquisgranensis]|uniref:ASCH domain-containing protein n=1 Tax=Acetatifactor aquisgranensis TaxID=2941233 RepID=UPI00203D1495|nr:ASCH domain-containing protein [Acetatifactor aquisgranensis]